MRTPNGFWLSARAELAAEYPQRTHTSYSLLNFGTLFQTDLVLYAFYSSLSPLLDSSFFRFSHMHPTICAVAVDITCVPLIHCCRSVNVWSGVQRQSCVWVHAKMSKVENVLERRAYEKLLFCLLISDISSVCREATMLTRKNATFLLLMLTESQLKQKRTHTYTHRLKAQLNHCARLFNLAWSTKYKDNRV